MRSTAEPCALVIFGATGDLTRRKLAPALYNLHLEGLLPSPSVVVGTPPSHKATSVLVPPMSKVMTRS